MRAIGIHYSNSHFHYVVLNQAGEVASRGKIRANRGDLQREFRAIEPTCIAMHWTPGTRWAAEMLSSMHHAVLYSAVRENSTHELSTPVIDWTDLDALAARGGADASAESHARRLRLQWGRGVARMIRREPAATPAMETAIYV